MPLSHSFFVHATWSGESEAERREALRDQKGKCKLLISPLLRAFDILMHMAHNTHESFAGDAQKMRKAKVSWWPSSHHKASKRLRKVSSLLLQKNR